MAWSMSVCWHGIGPRSVAVAVVVANRLGERARKGSRGIAGNGDVVLRQHDHKYPYDAITILPGFAAQDEGIGGVGKCLGRRSGQDCIRQTVRPNQLED